MKKNIQNSNKKLNKNFRIDVGIACIFKDGKYLVQSRPEGKSFCGFWEFPGGKREKGENFKTCVKREIQEEVRLDISVSPYFYDEIFHFKKTDLYLRFHLAVIKNGTPKALEKQKLKWIEAKDFFKEKFLPTNHKALRILQDLNISI
jgi:mutator protein MutT